MSMFLPLRCPLCGALGAAPCAACAASFVAASMVAPVPSCTSVAACFRYDAAVRTLLLSLKYRNRRDAVGFCAAALVSIAPAVDVVTWAPTTRARVRERGFDQAEVLARAVGHRVGVPVRRMVRRTGHDHQTGRRAADRRHGARFVPRGPAPAGVRVLLVDDIGTTGSTFAHAARALREAGVHEVHARAVAWTPPRSGPSASAHERSPRGKLGAT